MSTEAVDPALSFRMECARNISRYEADDAWHRMSTRWLHRAFEQKYLYNFSWLGRPIIQLPADMVALNELIWASRPDLIIETGIAHGGSLIMSASMLALLDYSDAVRDGRPLDPATTHRRVLGIDIDIRAHNQAAIREHPMAHRIDMIQGSSIARDVIEQVRARAEGFSKILVCLDSNHTHDHVLAELEAYAPLATVGSYCVVFDTIIEDMPEGTFPDRPWGRGNSPKTAVWEYLRLLSERGKSTPDQRTPAFEVDKTFESKLLITAAPSGYLKRTR